MKTIPSFKKKKKKKSIIYSFNSDSQFLGYQKRFTIFNISPRGIGKFFFKKKIEKNIA